MRIVVIRLPIMPVRTIHCPVGFKKLIAFDLDKHSIYLKIWKIRILLIVIFIFKRYIWIICYIRSIVFFN